MARGPGAPAPVLSGLRVLRYAFIRRPIRYAGQTGVLVGSSTGVLNELGPVPRLAIGQSIRGNREFFLLHCTRTWEVLGTQGGFTSSAQAERCASQIYRGVAEAWVETDVTIREAKAFERLIWFRDACSFCGRIPPELEPVGSVALFSARAARICARCVREFHQRLD
jgi:hypothetical protein